MADNSFERSRGILTSTDHRWLAAQTNPAQDDEFDRKANYRRRNAITNRLANALIDISTLATTLPDTLRKNAFQTLHENTSHDLIQTASAPITLSYLGLTDLVTDPAHHHSLEPVDIADTSLAFRKALRQGIKTGKQQHPRANTPPDTILIDTNTNLHEFPALTASDLPQDLYAKYGKGARDRDGTKLTEQHNFPPKKAITPLLLDSKLWIDWKLYNHRNNATEPINRHDTKLTHPVVR
ncbi:hypothetical protein [Halobacterium salinarum]|uniref:Uncharacterized protein n=1 Tax=Halobacterium salinarum (strain ATCC 33171 / DSM 3754 / JCM 8978 / NBRC 102687 / NCIMB 764 / 91-R6) TaxID=2597657 RepID=A0A4D6GUS5_HALS9|nr:hypothetical protein [Halobacterium salinarum]QCC43987.1 uncharacterized protein HBSAL_01230 [Halobacterium salinarum]TYO82481.1 hypothetical protein APQ99_01012 [Halobacterium salinarum DSM 3754]